MKRTKLTAFLLSAMMLGACGGNAAENDIKETSGTITDETLVTTAKAESAEITSSTETVETTSEIETAETTALSEETEVAETAVDIEIDQVEYSYDAELAAEEVNRFNGIAEQVAVATNNFLIEAKEGGYGMIDGAEGTFFCAYIDDGIWLLFLDHVDCFECADEFVQWWGCGEADKDSEYKFIEDNDSRFALRLAQALPDVKNASVGAWIENGECKAVYYTESTTTGDYQLDNYFGAGGWIAPTCEWDGYNQGVSDDGNFVGTYPVLGFEVIK